MPASSPVQPPDDVSVEDMTPKQGRLRGWLSRGAGLESHLWGTHRGGSGRAARKGYPAFGERSGPFCRSNLSFRDTHSPKTMSHDTPRVTCLFEEAQRKSRFDRETPLPYMSDMHTPTRIKARIDSLGPPCRGTPFHNNPVITYILTSISDLHI